MAIGHWLKNFTKWYFDPGAESGGGGGGGPIQLVPSISDIGYLEGWSLPSPGVIAIPDGVRGIYENAFSYCRGLYIVVMPSSLTSIAKGAFAYCDKLGHVNFPDGLNHLGEMAFIGCKSLGGKIIVPVGVQTIDKQTFMDCINLSDVILGDGVGVIADSAFENCTSLSNISLSSHLNVIAQRAFASCTSLDSIYLPASVAGGGIATDAFQGSGLTEINCAFAEGAVQGAPWGATNATVHYNV